MLVSEAFKGCRVQVTLKARWNDNASYTGAISEISGNTVSVKMDDGGIVSVSAAWCDRIPQKDGIYTCVECDSQLGEDDECSNPDCRLHPSHGGYAAHYSI